MILDTSALVAIYLKEPGWEDLVGRIRAPSGIGSPTLVETGIVLSARTGADQRAMLTRFLQEFGISQVPFGEPHWSEAVQAWLRFGKGRHAAGLNLGDCMAYATARLAGRPLLYVGDDFARTDVDGSIPDT